MTAVRFRPVRFLRFLPTRLLSNARRLVRKPEVSQARLKQFVREMKGRPPVSWPLEAPGSITLVVPCYMHAAFLPDLFESVTAQTRQPDELIFIDDGSPDDTREVAANLIARYRSTAGGRSTLLVNERNLGQAASLNCGIATASSDLIMILNDDDYLMHDAIEVVLDFFRQYPDVAMVGAGSVHFAGHDALAAAPKLSTAHVGSALPPVVHRPRDVPRIRNYTDLNMTHSSSCFRKVAWEAVGGYRVDKSKRVVPFSDRDFQLRINSMWPVAVAYTRPLAFWRSDSSVDAGRES